MNDPFALRFERVRAAHGPLVWGLDPSGALLESWGLGDTADGLDHFVDIVAPVATATVGLIKPQSAFYERHGWRGIRSLARLVTEARRAGLLVILDAKRGDVGTTNDAYAEAYLGSTAPIEVDALTIHPYLGIRAMGTYFERAHSAGSCVLVVTRSSNAEGRDIQAAVGVDGTTVEAALLNEIGEINGSLAPGQIGPVGAVIGPTTGEPTLNLVAANGLFLAPGVGAQGATPEQVAETFAACPTRVMPSASRSLLRSGPHPDRLANDLHELAGQFRKLL